MELINGMIADDGMVFGPTIRIAPHPLYPFPYTTYFIDSTASAIDSYYNDPALDAVTLEVTLGGDNAAWSDSGSYYNLGLLTPADAIDPAMSYYASGGLYDFSSDVLDTWHALGYFLVDIPSLKLTYSVVGQNDLGPGAQIIYLPGVASLTGYYSAYYNAVICHGSPVWFELEYRQNEYKSNPNLFYSGYTNFGDFSGAEFGQFYNYTAGGYVKRYVAGIIKKDADLATCTVSDIILGAIWTADDLGGGVYDGVGHVVLNGEIRASCTSAVKPENVYFSMDPITDHAVSELGDNPQYWEFAELIVEDSSFGLITYAFSESQSPNAIASDAVDVYDAKYAWYMDFDADLGPGTVVGEIGFYIPMMYTHPGWYEE